MSGGGFGHFPAGISDCNFRLKFDSPGTNLSFEEEAIDPGKAGDAESTLVEFFEVPNGTRFSRPPSPEESAPLD